MTLSARKCIKTPYLLVIPIICCIFAIEINIIALCTYFFPLLEERTIEEYSEFLLEQKLNEINDLNVITSTKYNYE